MSKVNPDETPCLKLVAALSEVHASGYAVGDLSSIENVFVRNSDKKIIFIDCNTGEPDEPNTDFKEDCTVELPDVAKRMFGKETPVVVKALLKFLKSQKSFNEKTLGLALAAIEA